MITHGAAIFIGITDTDEIRKLRETTVLTFTEIVCSNGHTEHLGNAVFCHRCSKPLVRIEEPTPYVANFCDVYPETSLYHVTDAHDIGFIGEAYLGIDDVSRDYTPPRVVHPEMIERLERINAELKKINLPPTAQIWFIQTRY